MAIRFLEYDEQHGQFHVSHGNHPQNSLGWQTVAKDEYALLHAFLDYLEMYHGYDSSVNKGFTFEWVKNEFEKFKPLYEQL